MLISTLSEGTYQAFPFNGIGKDPHMSMHRVLRERNSNAYDEVIKRKQFMVPPIQIPSSCKIPRLSTPKLPSLRNTSSTNALPRIMSSPLMSTTTDNPQGDLIGSAFMDSQSLAKARPDTTISPNLVSMYRDHYEYDYSPTTSQSSPLPFRSELVRKYAMDLNMKTDLMSMKRSVMVVEEDAACQAAQMEPSVVICASDMEEEGAVKSMDVKVVLKVGGYATVTEGDDDAICRGAMLGRNVAGNVLHT
ncbi:unnamed protein product [Albugo candida]|uniref:Uncharacterized protein n=1 Tax=Albugo candida TaxID=65357 RepID=A0A024G3I4_9STRA|nr:unnamed protein product [Albugo candida]|eukprot:CCI41132.1 unnamed protein product [Albugo candida]